MSHVAMVDAEILDLDSLMKACDDLGLEFRKGQRTYRWFGQHVGDYPLPKGFSKSDLGKCLHAIAVKGNSNAYEVGIVERRDGKPGYQLMWDFWAGGYGLQGVVGDNCKKLIQAYKVNVTAKALAKKGCQIQKLVDPKTRTVRLVGQRQ